MVTNGDAWILTTDHVLLDYKAPDVSLTKERLYRSYLIIISPCYEIAQAEDKCMECLVGGKN